jgi:predicted amidohydrolase
MEAFKMKIALYQGAGKPADVDENLAVIEHQALAAAEQGADLIIFPELFLTGYNIGPTAQELAQEADGTACRRASQIARDAKIAILYGYPEKLDAVVYNSALLVDRSGNTRANYRKTHLFGSYEKKYFIPGDALIMVELEGVNIGILICYDVEFPEAVRALTQAGAHLIAVPTALMKGYCRVAEHVVPARAYESEIYVAYVNRCGSEGDLTYCGRACLAGPDGRVILRAGVSEELMIADIDKQAIAAERETNPVLQDLRPDLYEAPVKTVRGR